MVGKGGGFLGETIKDTRTKQSGGWNQETEVGMAGLGREWGEMQTTVLEQQ